MMELKKEDDTTSELSLDDTSIYDLMTAFADTWMTLSEKENGTVTSEELISALLDFKEQVVK